MDILEEGCKLSLVQERRLQVTPQGLVYQCVSLFDKTTDTQTSPNVLNVLFLFTVVHPGTEQVVFGGLSHIFQITRCFVASQILVNSCRSTAEVIPVDRF